MNKREVLLNVTPFPQPLPPRNPGGDCFACALAAVVSYLYPDKPLDFTAAWEAFEVPTYRGGSDGTSKEKVLSNTWATMAHAAPYALHEHGYSLEVHKDIVQRNMDLDHHSNMWWRCVPTGDFAKRLEAWLSAGWVAIAEMNMAGDGPVTADGQMNHNDHFVALDGQRSYWRKHTTVEAWTLEHETHVICSRKGGYWISTDTLLERHGVAGLVLLRTRISTQ